MIYKRSGGMITLAVVEEGGGTLIFLETKSDVIVHAYQGFSPSQADGASRRSAWGNVTTFRHPFVLRLLECTGEAQHQTGLLLSHYMTIRDPELFSEIGSILPPLRVPTPTRESQQTDTERFCSQSVQKPKNHHRQYKAGMQSTTS